jgi:hypothetical protein
MSKIENNILAVTNAMLKDPASWPHVTKAQKEEFFFVINRLLARRFPAQAAALNSRHLDKAAAMDAWHALLAGRPYPSWMWSKRARAAEDAGALAEMHGLHPSDVETLARTHPEELAEETKNATKEKNKNR